MRKFFSLDLLDERRQACDMPWRQLALAVGTNPNAFQTRYRAGSSPSAQMLADISVVLGCSIDEFFEERLDSLPMKAEPSIPTRKDSFVPKQPSSSSKEKPSSTKESASRSSQKRKASPT